MELGTSTGLFRACLDEDAGSWTYFLSGQIQRPQHWAMSVRFFSASLMSLLMESIPSSIRSNCSVWTGVLWCCHSRSRDQYRDGHVYTMCTGKASKPKAQIGDIYTKRLNYEGKKLDTMRNLRINTNFWGTKKPSKFQISWSRQVFTFKPRKTCLPPCSSNITTVLIPTSLLWRREHITTRYWQEPQRRIVSKQVFIAHMEIDLKTFAADATWRSTELLLTSLNSFYFRFMVKSQQGKTAWTVYLQ